MIENCEIWKFISSDTFEQSNLRVLSIKEYSCYPILNWEVFMANLCHANCLESLTLKIPGIESSSLNETIIEKAVMNLLEKNKILKKLNIWDIFMHDMCTNINLNVFERALEQIIQSDDNSININHY